MSIKSKPTYHFDSEQIPEIEEGLEAIEKKWLLKHNYDSDLILYHYTNLKGLKEILETRALWLSHIKSFNDPSEWQYGQSLIIKELKNQMGDKLSPEINMFIGTLISGLKGFENLYHPYAACFCKVDNLLSQWKGYGASGGGCTIGMLFYDKTKYSHSNDLKDESHVVLRKIIYKESEQKEIIESTIKILIDSATKAQEASKNKNHLPESWTSKAAFTVVNILIDIILSLKNPAFHEEQEWRLIKTIRDEHKPHLVDFEARDNLLKAYLNTYIFSMVGDNFQFPCRSIRLGPMLDVISNKVAIELLVYKSASMGHKIMIDPKSVNIENAGFSIR